VSCEQGPPDDGRGAVLGEDAVTARLETGCDIPAPPQKNIVLGPLRAPGRVAYFATASCRLRRGESESSNHGDVAPAAIKQSLLGLQDCAVQATD